MGRRGPRPTRQVTLRPAIHAALASVWLAAPCLAQDSITVIDRGTPPARIWSIVEFPFKVLQVPLRLVEGAAGWLAARAEKGGWVSTARRADESLGARGVRLSVGGQGANSSVGPTLHLGRGPRANRRVWLEMRTGVTVRGYWLAEAHAGAPWAEAFAGFADRPREAFFGLGNGAREQDWSDYRLRHWTWGARAKLRVRSHGDVTAGFEWTRVKTGHGTAAGVPDIDSTFSPAERPGFSETHRYLWLSGSAELRSGARHSIDRRGSWLAASYRWGDSRTAGAPDVGVVRVTAGIEAPFDHRRRSVAVAVYFESLRPASPGIVPFYLLPTLGGSQSLPSFQTERFRARDALRGKVEYRYRIWSHPSDAVWVDAVWFTNGGMVADRMSAVLASARLHQSTGFAVALLTRQTTLARFGISKGADGIGLTFAGGASF